MERTSRRERDGSEVRVDVGVKGDADRGARKHQEFAAQRIGS